MKYPFVTLLPVDNGPAASAKGIAGDTDGKFLFPALLPGKYLAAAWDQVIDVYSLPLDPRTMRLYREKGKTVIVRSGKPPAVALTLLDSAEVAAAKNRP